MHNLRAGAFACLVSFACATGLAQATDLPGVDAFIQAADVVSAAQGTPGVDPPLPESDPRVRKVLALATDQAVFGKARLGAEDIPKLLDVCSKAVKVSVAYSMAGLVSLKPLFAQGPAVYQPRYVELVTRNAQIYQNVIIPLTAFGAYCNGRSLPLLTDFTQHLPASERTPVRMDGMRQARKGAANMIVAAVVMTDDPSVSAANRRLMLVAAADNAAAIATFMTVASRAPVLEATRRALEHSALENRPLLDTIAKSFADTSCTGGCALGE